MFGNVPLAAGRGNKKIYKTKEEIQVAKILESHTREELKNMPIIDIEDEFYKKNERKLRNFSSEMNFILSILYVVSF